VAATEALPIRVNSFRPAAPSPLDNNPGSGIMLPENASAPLPEERSEPEKAPRVQIGEAAARRHTAPIASMMLWAALCGSTVIALHKLSDAWAARQGSYRTGIITVCVFLMTALYPTRKYSLWFSLHWLRLASRLPRAWAVRLLLLDRLETWRVAHVTLGVFAMLPFWWHTEFGRRSLLELALEILIVLLVLSGFLGTVVEDFLPARMLRLGKQEVRLEDVEAASRDLYVEAEELVLGHSEALVHAYLLSIRPILAGNQPPRTLLWATLTGTNPASAVCKPARALATGFGAEAAVFDDLVNIAERKISLDHNQFNLSLSTVWLQLHRLLAIGVMVLIIFHVVGVLYFAGT
jgi:hypothetical protein